MLAERHRHTDVLAKAQRGVYAGEDDRDRSTSRLRKRYLLRGKGTNSAAPFAIVKELREAMIDFRQINLLHEQAGTSVKSTT